VGLSLGVEGRDEEKDRQETHTAQTFSIVNQCSEHADFECGTNRIQIKKRRIPTSTW